MLITHLPCNLYVFIINAVVRSKVWCTHCSPKAAEVCTVDLLVGEGKKSERLETVTQQ